MLTPFGSRSLICFSMSLQRIGPSRARMTSGGYGSSTEVVIRPSVVFGNDGHALWLAIESLRPGQPSLGGRILPCHGFFGLEQSKGPTKGRAHKGDTLDYPRPGQRV